MINGSCCFPAPCSSTGEQKVLCERQTITCSLEEAKQQQKTKAKKKENDPLVHVNVERCASFRTCRVGLLLVHGHKLGPLILGSDPLFPQEPTEQLALVFTARLV